MADTTDLAEPDGPVPKGRRRHWRVALWATGAAVLVAGGGLWLARNRIADGVIARELAALGLPARYTIVSIGPGREVLANVVVGDPARPDLVIERAELSLAWSLAGPRIGQVTLVRPRLYGTVHGGHASFGALDKVIYAPSSSKQPFRLPDWRLTIIDGRGLVDADQGRVAFKADGAGALRDGFAGTLAVVAPRLALGACSTGRATAFGRVTIRNEQPRFAGPVRVANLACGSAGLAVRGADLNLDALADRDLAGLSVKGQLRSSAFRAGAVSGETLGLDTALAWRGGALRGRVAATAGGVRTAQGGVGLLELDGLVKARPAAAAGGVPDAEFRGTIDARGLRRGPMLDQALVSAQAAVAGTLAAPMVAQVRRRLHEEERGSRFAADLTLRHGHDGAWDVVVAQGALRGGSGQALLGLNKVRVFGSSAATPRFAGNFVTGGNGLPRLSGTMERLGNTGAQFHLTMADYAVGGGHLAVPELVVVQMPDGALGFSGQTRLTGAIPGGRVENLRLPINGAYGRHGALALWRRCIQPAFDSLELGQMAIDGQTLTVCPVGGQAIVSAGSTPLRVALGTSALRMTGRMGETPLRLETGAVGLAWPGTLTARGVNVALGPEATATRLTLADLTARLGKDFTGSFAGVEARMAAVPLDITSANGTWRFADGKLALANTAFDLTDRASPARFAKLAARDATLTLADGRIAAQAVLRDARSGRPVTTVNVDHDLARATGHADLVVDKLVFDKDLQPAQLTPLALGLIANANGAITGKGRIDWQGDKVTSSGRFGSQGLDFAAAFGPVKGLSGTLDFTDLLAMETAPHQILKVASINPGVEVTDGKVDLQLKAGQVVQLNGAQWPFMGGRLSLEPTTLRFALAEERRFALVIEGLDAAQFVSHMEMANISATGTFDGRLPVVFDATGGHIVGGALASRGGGNVSYIGALTYKDLSFMANYAFQALRSLDYKHMTIALRGDIAGDFVTQVQFGGVSQGTGASRNFFTRQIEGLPIQFNLNVRAPFYSLLGTYKSMYDPSVVADPRTVGLLDAKGRVVPRTPASAASPAGQPAIQPSASGNMP
ncbi:hypothetical protein J2792_000098 [Novosphingobium capsulatum]|uniref:Dicarboxylate transport n=1 Tax=Novosphingobium capsulatum TaxID=13688 RepID=A0ABU1MFZ9_9SPHN|nr:YdbH domain-containing protein [Novosphingobium capsulatum]MDR6509258.1 hypothetical protein [Novosphingobium capsulatum]